MADLLSRLVERTLGTAPQVQPLGASTFSPAEPTGDTASLAQVEDTSTWPGSPDQAHTSPDTELPLQNGPDGESEVTAERRHDTFPLPQHYHGESESSERSVMPEQGEEHSRPTVPDPPRRTREPGGEQPPPGEHDLPQRGAVSGADRQKSLRRADPGPARRNILSRSEGSSPEDIPSGTPPAAGDGPIPDTPHAIGTIVDLDQSPVPLPMVPREERSVPEPVTVRDPTSSPYAPLVAPKMVRAALPRRKLPRPEVTTSEPEAPTVRVSIGRVEVKSVMPSAPPVRREPSARPGPALSLDDYLEQRNGGQR